MAVIALCRCFASVLFSHVEQAAHRDRDRPTDRLEAPPSACGGLPAVPVRVGVALRVSVSTAEGYARVAAAGLVRQDGCGCGLR